MLRGNGQYIRMKNGRYTSVGKRRRRKWRKLRRMLIRPTTNTISSKYLLETLLKNIDREITPDEIRRATNDAIRNGHVHKSSSIRYGGGRPIPKKDSAEGG